MAKKKQSSGGMGPFSKVTALVELVTQALMNYGDGDILGLKLLVDDGTDDGAELNLGTFSED